MHEFKSLVIWFRGCCHLWIKPEAEFQPTPRLDMMAERKAFAKPFPYPFILQEQEHIWQEGLWLTINEDAPPSFRLSALCDFDNNVYYSCFPPSITTYSFKARSHSVCCSGAINNQPIIRPQINFAPTRSFRYHGILSRPGNKHFKEPGIDILMKKKERVPGFEWSDSPAQ